MKLRGGGKEKGFAAEKAYKTGAGKLDGAIGQESTGKKAAADQNEKRKMGKKRH